MKKQIPSDLDLIAKTVLAYRPPEKAKVAPAVAVHWPESAHSDSEKAWLREHVGE